GVDRALARAPGVIGAGNGTGVCAAGIAQALFVVDVYTCEDGRVALPGGEVEQARARAEGRRIPVCPALDTRERRRARRLRRRERPALRVQAAGPIHVHDRTAGEKA